MVDEELERELARAWEKNKAKRDVCGLQLPTNKDMNLKRTHIRKNGILPRVN